MLSPQKAADRSGVSRKTIMDQISTGKLKAARNNQNRWQIRPEDLEEWISSRPRKPITPTTTDVSPDAIRLEEQLKAAVKEAATYQSQLQQEKAERREEREAARTEREMLLEMLGEAQKPRRGFWGFLR